VAKAKGTIVVPAARFLRTRGEQARTVLPERLRGYLEETLPTGQWYPEEDLQALLRAMEALMPGSGPGLYAQLGRAAAAEQLTRVAPHRTLDGHDPLGIARRSFALWSSMHDTGRMRIVDPTPEAATFVLEDYALPSIEMCHTVTGYFSEALRAAGLEADVRKRECLLEGGTRCAWQASWKAETPD
jgi:hypothetical protein